MGGCGGGGCWNCSSGGLSVAIGGGGLLTGGGGCGLAVGGACGGLVVTNGLLVVEGGRVIGSSYSGSSVC